MFESMGIERASQSSISGVIVVARLTLCNAIKWEPKSKVTLLWLVSTDAPCLIISSRLFSFLENSGCLLFSRNSIFAWSTRKMAFLAQVNPMLLLLLD